MSLRELYAKPGHLIRRAQQIAVAIFSEECAAHDITPVQYGSLLVILEYPDIDATRLSSLIAFDRSTIGSVIERLEIKGLITRVSSKEDRRIKLMRLTEAGQALLTRIAPDMDRTQERILAPLAPADRIIFVRLLEQLVKLNNEISRAPLKSEDLPKS